MFANVSIEITSHITEKIIEGVCYGLVISDLSAIHL